MKNRHHISAGHRLNCLTGKSLGKFIRKSYVVKIPTLSSKRGDVTKGVLTACKCYKLYC